MRERESRALFPISHAQAAATYKPPVLVSMIGMWPPTTSFLPRQVIAPPKFNSNKCLEFRYSANNLGDGKLTTGLITKLLTSRSTSRTWGWMPG